MPSRCRAKPIVVLTSGRSVEKDARQPEVRLNMSISRSKREPPTSLHQIMAHPLAPDVKISNLVSRHCTPEARRAAPDPERLEEQPAIISGLPALNEPGRDK